MLKKKKIKNTKTWCVSFFSPHSPCFFQVIAHHPMQSISFASGGDTVSAAFNSTSFQFALATVVVGEYILADRTYQIELH